MIFPRFISSAILGALMTLGSGMSWAETIETGPAGLMAAMKAAQPGDTIHLKAGQYGHVRFGNLKFSDYVTVASADSSDHAHFDTLTVQNSSYLRFDGIHVDASSDKNKQVVHITASSHIEILNSEINGKVDGVTPIIGPKFGILAIDSPTDLKIADTTIHNVRHGIAIFGGQRVELTDNNLEDIGEDSIKLSGVDTVRIENTIGPTRLAPGPKAHADFIQAQGPASHNLTIIGNLFMPEGSPTVQGIFIAGKGGHSNVHISQNIIYTRNANGIAVYGSKGIEIRNNTLINALDLERPVTRIAVKGEAVIADNLVSARRSRSSGTNIEMQHLRPNQPNYMGDFFPGVMDGNGDTISLEDLRPAEGSLADGPKGAYRRLMELLAR